MRVDETGAGGGVTPLPLSYFDVLNQQIGDFVRRVVRPGEITVGLLRYGAHVPHLAAPVLGDDFEVRMVLSHLLRYFPRSFFRDKDFLVLDDSMYRGVAMGRILQELAACGVPAKRVRTAALVVHRDCPSDMWPTEYADVLGDADYIDWKEDLTAAVRADMRPTERDHPLYYFTGSTVSVAALHEAARQVGAVQSVQTPSETVLKFTVTFSEDSVRDLQLAGVTFPAPSKIRFYCREDKGAWSITAVPIVPTIIDVRESLQDGGVRVAEALGLPRLFFKDIAADDIVGDSVALSYFYVNRGLAAALLERFLCQAQPFLRRAAGALAPERPEDRDGVVKYEFPSSYADTFHPAVYERLSRVLTCNATGCSHGSSQLSAPTTVTVERLTDELLPTHSRLLVPLLAKGPAVEWSEENWEPRPEGMPEITYTELLAEFRDKLFVSEGLDELLDDGLIRAKDARVGPGEATFGRVFLPGGEYRALEVFRLARAWQTPLATPELLPDDGDGES